MMRTINTDTINTSTAKLRKHTEVELGKPVIYGNLIAWSKCRDQHGTSQQADIPEEATS